ncbi:MAG: PDZ domain-containing protein [candidate division NC10 bacterium]|nr:PDZ domain-containing protein [candidate division NC10 bacterium]
MSDPSFRARGVSLPAVLLVAVISLAAGVLLAVAFGLTRPPTVQRFWSELQPPSAPQADVLLPGRPDSFATLVRRLKGTVVNINTTKRVRLPKDHPDVENPSPEKGEPRDFFDKFFGGRERDFNQRNMGSGVIIHPDGYIVTNDHVVDGTEAIQVRLSSGQQYRAEVVGTDSKTDLALIKIRADAPLPVATIGDSDKLEVGDWVLAIGNPFGFDHSVTAGIVSGKGRVLGSGPYARSRFGFAIPSNMAKTVLLQLKARGKVTRGWLGVVIQQVTPPAADALGLRESQGALVSEVMVDSPAEKVGIRRGDVILRFRGKSVTEVRDLPRFVAETHVGAEVELDILRDGKSRTLHLRVGELREKRLAQVHPQDPGFGLTVQDLTPELAKGLGVPEGQGVAVTRVAPGSASEEAGIRQGDVIVEVNRKSVKTRDAFESVMRQRSGGSSLMFLVRRGDITRYIAMKGE